MDSREDRIREQAYMLWKEEGEPVGRHDDHWFRAQAALGEELAGGEGFSSLGAEAPQSGTEDQSVPPARTGKAERQEDPVTAGDASNPVHHEGRLPSTPGQSRLNKSPSQRS